MTTSATTPLFGISIRHPHLHPFHAMREATGETASSLPAVLEVLPDHFFSDHEALVALGQAAPLIYHDVGLSIGTADSPEMMDLEEERLHRLRDQMDDAPPLLFTEHLAMTRSPSGIDVGHLVPIWYTEESLQLICDKLQRWQEVLGVPMALENITWPFQLPGADMSEAAFFRACWERTGTGILLDLTNLLYNARNFGEDAEALLISYPLEAIRVVHLAGGFCKDGWWVDSHSRSIEPDAVRLLRHLRHKATSLLAVIIERDDEIPPFEELCEEALAVAHAWQTDQWS